MGSIENAGPHRGPATTSHHVGSSDPLSPCTILWHHSLNQTSLARQATPSPSSSPSSPSSSPSSPTSQAQDAFYPFAYTVHGKRVAAGHGVDPEIAVVETLQGRIKRLLVTKGVFFDFASRWCSEHPILVQCISSGFRV